MNINFPSFSLDPIRLWSCSYQTWIDHQNKVTQLAQDILKVTTKLGLHSGLILAKVIIVPIELAAICLIATATAISLVVSLPYCETVSEDKAATLYHKLTGILYDVLELTWITLRYGTAAEIETEELADDQLNSPTFVVINPDTPIRPEAYPTLYAPGYLDTPDSLHETCRNMANNYQGPVYIVRYRWLFQSIEEHAKDVARVVQRILNDTQKNGLILAGHSMGGLVTGNYVLDHAPQDLAIKLWITIGSPLLGTPLAPLGIGACARDMHSDSEFIKKLNQPNRLDSIDSLHIGSAADHIVSAEYTKRLNRVKAINYLCSIPHGHLSIRACKEVDEKIKETMLKIK